MSSTKTMVAKAILSNDEDIIVLQHSFPIQIEKGGSRGFTRITVIADGSDFPEEIYAGKFTVVLIHEK